MNHCIWMVKTERKCWFNQVLYTSLLWSIQWIPDIKARSLLVQIKWNGQKYKFIVRDGHSDRWNNFLLIGIKRTKIISTLESKGSGLDCASVQSYLIGCITVGKLFYLFSLYLILIGLLQGLNELLHRKSLE